MSLEARTEADMAGSSVVELVPPLGEAILCICLLFMLAGSDRPLGGVKVERYLRPILAQLGHDLRVFLDPCRIVGSPPQ